jgi:predicted nucleotidyltransferase
VITGTVEVDAILDQVIPAVRDVLPPERRCVLLAGSWAANRGGPMSDIDIGVLWQPGTNGAMELISLGPPLTNRVDLLSGNRVDLVVHSVADLSQPWNAWIIPGLLDTCRLIDGADLRTGVSMPTQAEYVRSVALRASRLMGRIRDQNAPGRPVAPPDASIKYLGYARQRTWYPRGVEGGTKELLALVAACACALFAKRANCFVRSKLEALSGYSSLGAPWSGFVAEVAFTCDRLGYRLPESAPDQLHLQELCRQVPDFEEQTLAELASELVPVALRQGI